MRPTSRRENIAADVTNRPMWSRLQTLSRKPAAFRSRRLPNRRPRISTAFLRKCLVRRPKSNARICLFTITWCNKLAMSLKFTILGCGSSGGVPRPALGWGECDPNESKNRRRRTSLLVEQRTPAGVTRILVDTSPDLREQLLDAGVDWL